MSLKSFLVLLAFFGATNIAQAKLCAETLYRPIYVSPPRDNIVHEFRLDQEASLLLAWGELDGIKLAFGLRLDGKLVFLENEARPVDIEQQVVSVQSSSTWLEGGKKARFHLQIRMGENDFGRPSPIGYELSFQEMSSLGFAKGPEQLIARVERGELEYLRSYETLVLENAALLSNKLSHVYIKHSAPYFSSGMRGRERN